MALPLLAGLGAGKIISIAGGSSLLGNASNLLTSSLGSIASNPLGTLTNIGQNLGSTLGNVIGGIFGGEDNTHIMSDREDIVLGNGSTALAILYNHPAKQGGKIIVTEPMDVPDMFFQGKNWHDAISTIDIADGASITFYEHPNFGGLFDGLNGTNMRSASNPNVNRPGTKNTVNLYDSWRFWNDRISSFKVTGTPTYSTKSQQTQPIQHGLPYNNFVESNFIGPQFPTNPLGNTGTSGINPNTNINTNIPLKEESNSMMYILMAIAGFFIYKKMK